MNDKLVAIAVMLLLIVTGMHASDWLFKVTFPWVREEPPVSAEQMRAEQKVKGTTVLRVGGPVESPNAAFPLTWSPTNRVEIEFVLSPTQVKKEAAVVECMGAEGGFKISLDEQMRVVLERRRVRDFTEEVFLRSKPVRANDDVKISVEMRPGTTVLWVNEAEAGRGGGKGLGAWPATIRVGSPELGDFAVHNLVVAL